MRRFLVLIIAILVLAGVLPCFAVAGTVEETPVLSMEALDQFSGIWNDYYDRYRMNIHGGYTTNDDQATLDGLCITYNGTNKEVEYSMDLIPSTANLFFIFKPIERIYGFCIFSNDMKSDLEKIVIYSDDKVINNADVGSSHSPQDMWSITLTDDEVLDLYSQDQFTIRLTVDGKNEIIDISRDKQEYLYDMVTWLIKAQLYADTTYEKYLSSEFLPGGIRSTPTPIPTEAAYSFRGDYDAIDRVAKSVFYVETYDKNMECLASASGFVSFDEHLFVTNQHVIDGATYLKVWDDDNNMYIIDKVVVSDEKQDIALLLFDEGEKYDSLEREGEKELKRGQPVTTIGSPKGFQNSVAFGNISAFPEEDGIKYIQFTAPISHGSSGGCLLDDAGKVIGITTAGIDEGQNINFAIPVKLVQDLYEKWDKNSYELLGTKRSWNMAGITPTPSPTPSPTPTPTPTPSPTPEPTISVKINQKERSGVYKGDLVDGKPQGQGTFDSRDELPSLFYEGGWDKGAAVGEGMMKDEGYTIHFEPNDDAPYDKTGVFEGEVIDGIPSGKGKFITKNSEGITWTYTGEFSEGTFNGLGETVWDYEDIVLENGSYTNGIYTPSWSQVLNTMALIDGYTIKKKSLAFVDDNEIVFTSQSEIDPSIVYDKPWLGNAVMVANPSFYSDQLFCIKGLNVVQCDVIEGYGRDCTFAILEDSNGILYYGYFGTKVVISVNSTIDEVFLLPLNKIKYKNSNNEDLDAILCAFAGLGSRELIPTPSPTPEPTPTPIPTPTPEPTPTPTLTPQVVNYGDASSARIELTEQELSVYIGTPVAIVPSIVSVEDGKPVKGAKLSWDSSDPSVAEVNKNLIVGKTIGDATITCKLEDDESVYTFIFVHVLEPVTDISFTEQILEMPCNTEDNKYMLAPVLKPESASYEGIEFSSSNDKVASVDSDGVITAIGPGKAKITATVKLNGVKKIPRAMVDVSVVNRITEISDESTYSVSVGKTQKLVPTIIPDNASNKKLNWETTNKDIATVDANGVVKGIKAGICTVTATSQDGGNVKKTYQIVVQQPVTGVKLYGDMDSKTSYTHQVGEKLPLYLFEVEPSNASNKELMYEIFKDGKKTSFGYIKGTDNSITFNSPGMYAIQATSTDGTNKSAKLNLRVYPKDLNTLSLNYARWQPQGGDLLSVTFEINNADYGLWIDAVELYVYATDSWGNKIYGSTIYNGTTNKDIGPGQKLYSDRILLPNRSRISKIYCGVHKIKFFGDDFGVKTYTVDYYEWSYK